MNAIILSVGDELILGQTVDTNSAWISQHLASVGCEIIAHTTVADDQPAIERAMRDSAARADFLIISGGIGPTADDLTRQALAGMMGAELVASEFWLEKLKGFFEKRGRAMPEMNKIQAMIPRGANLIDNTNGTAAGIDAVVNVGDRPCRVFVMPGVPGEMKRMFLRDVLPHVLALSGGAAILSRTLHTFGLGESTVAQHLGNLMDRTRNPSVGTTVSNGIVSLRVNARFPSRIEAEEHLEKTVFACRAALGDLIFGKDDDTLSQIVANLLATSRLTIAAAETISGGLLSKMLTDAPESAAYFTQGWVAEATEAHAASLGVPPGMIQSAGPASEAVTAAMAHAARARAKAQVGLGVNGLDSGVVCIALSHEMGSKVRAFNFSGDRDFLRDRAAKMALTVLRFHLLGKDLPF